MRPLLPPHLLEDSDIVHITEEDQFSDTLTPYWIDLISNLNNRLDAEQRTVIEVVLAVVDAPCLAFVEASKCATKWCEDGVKLLSRAHTMHTCTHTHRTCCADKGFYSFPEPGKANRRKTRHRSSFSTVSGLACT